jgi:GNAT superfamily N-acetyltransferase
MCQFEFRPNSPLADCNQLYKAAGDHGRAGPTEARPGLYCQQQLVAIARLLPGENAWLLRNLCVAPAWRGQRLGQVLMAHIHQHWPQHTLYLRPLPGLEPYYRQLGYQPLPPQSLFRARFPKQRSVTSVMFRAVTKA